MTRAMPSHQGNTCRRLPPREMIDALVDAGPNHWLWNGDFARFDDIRVAVIRWAPIDLVATYVVARVLWAHAHDGRWPRRFRNDCGLTTCVRPDHFSEALPRDQASSPSIRDGADARAVRSGETTHAMRPGVGWFVCGIKPRATTEAARGAPITCRDCADTLRAVGEAKEQP